MNSSLKWQKWHEFYLELFAIIQSGCRRTEGDFLRILE